MCPLVLGSNPALGTTMDFWRKPRALSFSLSEESESIARAGIPSSPDSMLSPALGR
jgi:hypothetical protein